MLLARSAPTRTGSDRESGSPAASRSAAARFPESRRGARARARRAASRAAVLRCTDGAAWRTARRPSASSTISPPYITITRDVVSAMTPRSWVISRIDVPNALLQVDEQLEDLRLDGDVERGGRLVGDDERGVHHERHRDHDALAHAAGELVRVLAGALLRRRNADELEHLDGAVPRVAPAHARVHARDFGDLVADGEDRIERRHRLLEDHRDAIAADVAHLLVAQRDEVLSLELDAAAGLDSARRLNQPQDRQRGDRLSAARFADDPDRLAGPDVEGDAVDRARDAALGVELGAQIVDGEKRRRHCVSRPALVGVAERFSQDVERHHRQDHQETGKE